MVSAYAKYSSGVSVNIGEEILANTPTSPIFLPPNISCVQYCNGYT